jgi:hypothetical protein
LLVALHLLQRLLDYVDALINRWMGESCAPL